MTTTQGFLLSLKQDLEKLAGEWNGDESGLQEEESQNANEAIEKLDELLELLKTLGY